MIRRFVLLVFGLGIVLAGPASAQAPSGCDRVPASTNCKLLADFESDTLGGPPSDWRDTRGQDLVRLTKEGVMTERKNVYVRSENGNQFARIDTEARALQVVMSRKNGLDWNLDERPYLRWRWRAKALPEGASEKRDETNDTGGALYVTFETDILGQPKSIKYTYSSTLPVGTTVDYGTLKVLVVASRQKQGLDEWIAHERNVVEDYKRLFGESPDKTPLAVMMWSDSDTMNSVGTIDFDDLMFLAKPSRSADSATTSSQ